MLATMLCLTAARGTDLSRMVLSGRSITSADGLSGNTIYDIVQDDDGYIWMGAAYGLCRYDGYSFVNHYSLSDDTERKIYATTGNLYHDSRNSLLWIHTSTFAFACYDLRAGHFADYTGRGDENRPYRRFLCQKDNMWLYDIGSGIRRVRYHEGRFACTDYRVDNKRLPSNNVPRMVEDGRHNVWALTTHGLLKSDSNGTMKTVVKNRKYLTGNTYRGNVLCLSADNKVEMFSPDGKRMRGIVIPRPMGNLGTVRSEFVWRDKWLIFGNETFCVDLKTWQVSKPAEYQVRNGLLLDSADGFFFESNESGRLWIFAPDGTVKSLSLLPDVRFTAERRRKYNIRRGHDGLFYIASYGNGLFVYDHHNGALRHFSATDPQPAIANNHLTNIFIDRSGNLWAAQEADGVAYITVAERSVADFIQPAPGHHGDWANWVRMAAYGRDGNIVISTKNNKLYHMDPETGRLRPERETNACAYAYLIDSRSHEWIATRGDGLYVDGVRYCKQDDERHTPSNHFYDIEEDRHGRIWLASSEDGLIMTHYEEGSRPVFLRYLNRSVNESRLHQLELDSEGRLWVASSNGLYMVDTDKKDITDTDFKCFNASNSDFTIDEMRCVKYVAGKLWAGGKGSGVVRCTVEAEGDDVRLTECTTVDTGLGLADNTVCAITDDSYGCIWAATENGLSHINHHDMKVNTYRFGNEPGQNMYSEGCALRLKDGRLLFGTRNGLTVITPKKQYEHKDTSPPEVCITGIKINGTEAGSERLKGIAPSRLKKITLASNENTVLLSFSNFEYDDIGSSIYHYYLEGSDGGWRPQTSINYVEYGNLDPGTYTFHLRSMSDNKWSAEKTLVIKVLQPWYNTWTAWLIYVAFVAVLCLYIYNNARERLRLNEQMRLEKQLTEFRLTFFTNITHEFRTPLAIIQGAVDKLNDSGAGQSRAAVQTARRATRRLLRMVNMLMEFRKVNTGNMRLAVERGDIVTFVHDIYRDFWNMAKQKDIVMTFTPFDRHHDMPFDRQMVETMVYNLLSNAVKYTPARGCVGVTIRKDSENVAIAVEDNGPGIDNSQMASLFQPFMKGRVSQGGMGIGLYTSYRMALLHKGNLTYRRATAEGGSVFTVTLPDSDAAYTADDYKKAMAIDTSRQNQHDDGHDEIVRELRPEAMNDVSIAIIEDDSDMMEQMSGELATYFRIDGYTTGQAGLEGITAHPSALVVCDVMLPDMNGYDIVRTLKSDDDTAHIPVIMLTALDDDKHRLRSYEAGADDYMVKPCNQRLLVARAVQLIKNSRKVAAKPQAAETTPSQQDSADTRLLVSQADKRFLEKMSVITAQHIADPDFTVDRLAELLGMGRTKVFTKTKELTGLSPNKYIQNERMRIAAGLLLEGEMTVAEVSYKVGIQDASYFNKCFKARYGVVPSKYGKA